MPGPHETFGLVALEAACSGAPVALSRSAPSARAVGDLAETFGPRGLLAAIERARARRPDRAGAAALARRSSWEAAFASELAQLYGLVRRPELRAVA